MQREGLTLEFVRSTAAFTGSAPDVAQLAPRATALQNLVAVRQQVHGDRARPARQHHQEVGSLSDALLHYALPVALPVQSVRGALDAPPLFRINRRGAMWQHQ